MQLTKESIKWMAAVLLALSLCTFTSCGDDDEEESIVGQTSNAENGSQEESDSQANSDLIGYYTHNEFRTQVDREADALNSMGMNNSSYWNELAQRRSTGLHIVDGHTAHWVVQGVALSNRNSNYIVYATDRYGSYTLYFYLERNAWKTGTYTRNGSTIIVTMDGREYTYTVSAGGKLSDATGTYSKYQ